MPRHPYCSADLPPLAGALRALQRGLGSEVRFTASRLRKNLNSSVSDGWNLTMHIESAPGRLPLTEEAVDRLRHVNNRLLELEKSLKQMVNGCVSAWRDLIPWGWNGTSGKKPDLAVWMTGSGECCIFSHYGSRSFLIVRPIFRFDGSPGHGARVEISQSFIKRKTKCIKEKGYVTVK